MNNKIFYIFAGVIVLIGLISLPICFKRIKVEAGQQVVLVKKPMFFGHGGVVKDPIKTGYVSLNEDGTVTSRRCSYIKRWKDL